MPICRLPSVMINLDILGDQGQLYGNIRVVDFLFVCSSLLIEELE
jgi:hypothetical protein